MQNFKRITNFIVFVKKGLPYVIGCSVTEVGYYNIIRLQFFKLLKGFFRNRVLYYMH